MHGLKQLAQVEGLARNSEHPGQIRRLLAPDMRGNDEHRRRTRPALLQSPQELEPIEDRHHQVEKEQARLRHSLEQPERSFPEA